MTEADLPSDFLRILTTFADHKVAFVLIGMGAGWIHGSQHRTEDLDFLIAGDLENRHRAAMALTELGARVQNGPPPNHDDLLGGNTLWETRHGHVDILLNTVGPDHTQLTYRDIEPHAVAVEGLVVNNEILIASLDDLITMKQAAGRVKDLEVLPELRAMKDRLDNGEPQENP